MDFCSILKLARIDVGNISKKGENKEGIVTCSIFASWFLTELCLYMVDMWTPSKNQDHNAKETTR